VEPSATSTSKPGTRAAPTKNVTSANTSASGVITYPADKNFIAYNGDEPPWD